MSLLLVWTLRSAATILLGLMLCLGLRKRSAAVRNLVLRLTLAVCGALPLVALVAPQVAMPIAPPAVTLAPAAPSVPKTFSALTPPITEGWSIVQPDPKDVSTLGVMRVTPFSTLYPTDRPFLLLWGVGTGFLVLRWLVGFARLRRIAGRGVPMRAEVRAPRVLLAGIAVPATYGRTILLPLDAEGWPEARLRAAVEHERAHVVRKDWIWQTLAALFCAVHWINPLAWLLARILRDSAESAADDAVLASGLLPSAYARELLAVAANVGPTGPALAMARRGGVKDRIAAILTDCDRRGPSRRATAFLLASLAIAGLAVAGITRVDRRRNEPLKRSFYGPLKLSDGRTVRLIAVRRIVAGRPRAWAPDGGVAPADLWRYIAPPPSGIRTTEDEGSHSYHFILSLAGRAVEDPGVYFAHPIGGGFATSGTYVRGRKDGYAYEIATSLPKSQTVTSLHLGFSSGPWRTMREIAFDQKAERNPNWANGHRAPIVRVSVDRREIVAVNARDWRLEAFDDRGRIVPRRGSKESDNDRMYETFKSSRPIARVRLQVRDYEFVDFQGVRLAPNPVRIAAPRLLRTGGTLRLVALREGSAAWRPDGIRLPKRTERDPFQPRSGKRAITFEFERVGPDGPNAPGILTRDFLHASGRPGLLIDTPDEMEMVAPHPTYAASSTGDRGSEPGAHTTRPTVTRELDSSLLASDVRVRLSSGSATVSDKPVKVLKTKRVAKVNYVNHRWYPGVSITARVPKSLLGKTVLLRAFDAKGLMIEGSSPTAPFADGTISVTYDVEDPKQIARYEWAHRTPEFVEFKAVHLYPSS